MASETARRTLRPIGLTKPEFAFVLLAATFALILASLAAWLAARIGFSRSGSVVASLLDADEPAWPFRRADAGHLGLGRVVKEDLRGASAFLQGHDAVSGDKLGITGFCMGGGLTLVAACDQPEVFGAVVPWYGLIPWPDAEPDWSKQK